MIDIHCHILPGIDDGAVNMEESLEMAKLAVKEGIRTIIATPHHKNGVYDNSKTSIVDKVNELNEALQKESIPVKILPGQETRIYGEMVEDYQNDEILPLNGGNYLFVELPSSHVPRYTEQLLFDLQMKGLSPIIVHPERNREIIERPEKLYQLVKKGALTQVTASSVAGYFGKNIKKFSLQLIDANLTHFVSSDAHNLTRRSFKMVEALDVIEKKFGMEMVYQLTENSDLLVGGLSVNRDMPERIKRKRFLGIF